ncbi:MAG: PadR family transcriptional regulator [Clostridiales bacterium]|nr:PadR family transcriptional regulator [Clostridiales bacterium]
MDVQLKKGLLEACVLAALKREESYGYKIMAEVSPYIEISESTLYPILRRLEGMGCLTTHTLEKNGRLRKYYMLTEGGHRRLLDFVDGMDEFQRVYRFVSREALM